MLFKPKNKGKSATLFFISGPVPTEREKADALKLNARLRNAESYSDEDAIEEAQFLAGAVPAGLVERMRANKMVVELVQASDVRTEETQVAPVTSIEQDQQDFEAGASYGKHPGGILPEGAPEQARKGFEYARAMLEAAPIAEDSEVLAPAAPVVTEPPVAPVILKKKSHKKK